MYDTSTSTIHTCMCTYVSIVVNQATTKARDELRGDKSHTCT